MRGLSGRVALVTGGAQGIGRATALRLAAEGSKVVVGYHSSREAAIATVAEIEEAGGEAIAVPGDVRRCEDADALVAAAMKAFARVDILVNNAGVVRDALLLLQDEEDWDLVVDTSLKGAFHLCRAAVP